MSLVLGPAIPAAGTYTYEIISELKVPSYVTFNGVLDFGSAGGTSITAYLQTTFNDGRSWRDVATLQFLLADVEKTAILSRVAAAVMTGGSDGALVADTIVNGVFGHKWRLKVVVVGAYAADSVIYLHVHFDHD